MPAHLEVGVRFGDPVGKRADPGAVLRLILLADFSGGRLAAQEAQQVPQPGGAYPLQRVDLDTLERAFVRFAPRVALAGGDDPTVMEFRSLEDFHPERILQRVEFFARLLTLRARLLEPATFAEASAELRAHGLGGGVSPLPGSALPGGAESDSGTLERLLGKSPSTGAEARKASASAVADALIRRVVTPATSVPGTPQLSVYLGAIDEAIGERVRQLLHSAAFMNLEAAWRAVDWLVTRLPLDEALQLYLLDVSRDELVSDLLATQSDPSRSRLALTLRSASSNEAGYWGLLAALFSFGPEREELAALAELAAVASQVQAPVVAAAKPALFGCSAVSDLPDPLAWQPLTPQAATQWASLRGSAAAPWLGLVAPRLLLRLPYGKAGEPLETLAFEEQPPVPEHDLLLWGPGSLAVALLLGEAYVQGGWEQMATPGEDIDDLPGYAFVREGETQLMPCAEAWLGERAAAALLAHGVMPLLSDRQMPRVRLARIQSVADPPRRLAARLP
jgi:type VI secretion system protein ImpC